MQIVRAMDINATGDLSGEADCDKFEAAIAAAAAAGGRKRRRHDRLPFRHYVILLQ